MKGKLPGGVTGGYDFFDVRDVADGVIAAAEKGRKGECYILSNRFVPIPDLMKYMQKATGGPKKIFFRYYYVNSSTGEKSGVMLAETPWTAGT